MRSVAAMALCLLAVAGAHADDTAVRGAATLAPFKSDLQAALQAGLADGPVAAIEVCRLRAPSLAQAASTAGVRVGRASLKLRNPGNSPADWLRPVLAQMEADPAVRQPRVVDRGNGRRGYAEPIVVQPLCLACHGEAVAPAVREQLTRLYPADEALGYRVGDLRGAFWVEFD